MRLFRLLLGLIFLGVFLARADAQDEDYVTYHVVALPPNPSVHVMGVAIGQEIYPMRNHAGIPMLFTGRAPGGQPYRYVVMEGAESSVVIDSESFERPAITQASETFNEVYGRPWNKLDLPELPQLYSYPGYVTENECKLFEEGVIATIHIEANEEQVQAMHADKDDLEAFVTGRLTYISYNDVQQVDGVMLKLGGHSSRKWAKVPYKIKIAEEAAPNGLYRRWDLKLRSETSDPTMLREKLYGDMLDSSGVLAPRSAYVRVFINTTPVGLFLLVEDGSSKSFIRENLHDGQDVKLGSLIKGDAGKGHYAANFGYMGPDASYYDENVYTVEIEASPGQPPAMDALIKFMSYIQHYDVSTVANAPIEAVLDQWQPKMDIIRYIHQLALEFIGGHWDGVQYSGNNFALYRHPRTGQYIMIPMDFDFTFGSGLEEDQRLLMTGDWRDFIANRKIHSYLWEKLKDIPAIVDAYVETIHEMIDTIGHPDYLLRRIDALAYMIQRDVGWDRSLERLTEGTTRPWSNDNFLEYLDKGPGDTDQIIGLKEWVTTKYRAAKGMLNPEIIEADRDGAANQLADIADSAEEKAEEANDDDDQDDGFQANNAPAALKTAGPQPAVVKAY